MFLVVGRCPEEVEQRHLRCLYGKIEVVSPSDQQDRRLDAREEIQRLRFGHANGVFQAAGQEDRGPETRLEGEHRYRAGGAHAVTVVRNLVTIEIVTAFEVIDRS